MVGKKWEINQTYPLETGGAITRTGNAEVQGREQLQTKAGSLDTLRIQQHGYLSHSANNQFGAKYQYTYWYAPAAKTIVKMEYNQTSVKSRVAGGINRLSEVTAYKVGTCD